MSLLLFFRRTGPAPSTATEADSFHALGAHESDFPLLLVEVAFATAPTAADQTWTDVTDYVRAISIRRGRDHELQRAEAGTMSVLLDNRDRRFDPTYTSGAYYPNVLPMRQIRVRAYWGGTVYDLYRGFVEAWPQAWPEYGKDAVVEVTAFDALGALQLASPVGTYRLLVLSDDPVGYWRLGEAAGIVALDETSNNNDGFYRTSGRALVMGATGANLAGDGDPAVQLVFDPAPADEEYVEVPDDATLDVGDVFSVEFWIKVTSYGNGVRVAGKTDFLTGAGAGWNVWVNLSGAVELREWVGANTIVSSSVAAGTGWEHYVVTKNGSTRAVYRNGVDVTSLGTNVTLTSTSHPWRMLSSYAGGSIDVSLDDVALYDYALTAAQAADHYQAGASTRPAETAADRIGYYLDTVAWPTGLRDLDTGQTSLTTSDVADGTAADAIQAIAEGERGLVFANPGGTVVFQDRHWRVLNAATAGAVLGDGGGTEIPVGDIVAGYDVQDVWNHIVVTPNGGTAVTASDASSQAAYYRRSLELSLQTTDRNEAQAAADYMLARYKDPHLRVNQVTMLGGSGTSIWPHALGGDISTRWTVRRRPPAGGTIETDVHLEAVEHDIRPGPVWTTTWSLSPADPQQYWVLDDAALSVLDSTTRLAY